jgi:SAM-dependent methyltransferase
MNSFDIESYIEELEKNSSRYDSLFQQLREGIRRGRYRGAAFNRMVRKYVDFKINSKGHPEETGYDNLDAFINGLSLFRPMPEQTKALEPEMVYYQKTPARIVFELVEKAHFGKEDVFFDLGSGLGQVAILVNLLAEIPARGIEFEPAFCDYARNCAAELNLSNVTFINVDARAADFSEGTIFFMFTPFQGEILQAVLAALRKESLQRKIKIITYGPCTARVALQNWLEPITPLADNIYTLEVFSS